QVPTLMKATSDDDTVCPGYLFEEIGMFSGPLDPVHGIALYQRVRAAAQELASVLFSDSVLPPPALSPCKASAPAGMGSETGLNSGMQGFGYSPGRNVSTEGTLLDRIQKAAVVVANAIFPPLELPSSCLHDNSYQPVMVPSAAVEASVQLLATPLPSHSMKAQQRRPGLAGGGWEESDSGHSSQNSSLENGDLGRASVGGSSKSGTDSQSGASRESGNLSERVLRSTRVKVGHMSAAKKTGAAAPGMELCPFCGKPFKRLKSHLPHCKMASVAGVTAGSNGVPLSESSTVQRSSKAGTKQQAAAKKKEKDSKLNLKEPSTILKSKKAKTQDISNLQTSQIPAPKGNTEITEAGDKVGEAGLQKMWSKELKKQQNSKEQTSMRSSLSLKDKKSSPALSSAQRDAQATHKTPADTPLLHLNQTAVLTKQKSWGGEWDVGPGSGQSWGGEWDVGPGSGQSWGGEWDVGPGSGQSWGGEWDVGPGSGQSWGGEWDVGPGSGQSWGGEWDVGPGSGQSWGGEWDVGPGSGQSWGGEWDVGPGSGQSWGGEWDVGPGSGQSWGGEWDVGPGSGQSWGGEWDVGPGSGQSWGGEWDVGPGSGQSWGGEWDVGPGSGQSWGGEWDVGPGSGQSWGGEWDVGPGSGQSWGGEWDVGPGSGQSWGGEWDVGPGSGQSWGGEWDVGPGSGQSWGGEWDVGPGSGQSWGGEWDVGPGSGQSWGGEWDVGPGSGQSWGGEWDVGPGSGQSWGGEWDVGPGSGQSWGGEWDVGPGSGQSWGGEWDVQPVQKDR
ncbi:UNVERIFIED_CONTAM: hypothetical protein FKN15_040698, partial [Acipenser sinensis]